VWTAIGAAGGIFAYRKGAELLEQAREQGVALTIQQVALTTTQAISQISTAIGQRASSEVRLSSGSKPTTNPDRSAGEY
jgi:hypothetical protein